MGHVALLYKVLWYIYGFAKVGEKDCKGAMKFDPRETSLANR